VTGWKGVAQRIIGVALAALLPLWMFLVDGFWIGFLPRSRFAISGPISWPLFLFVAPLLCVAYSGASQPQVGLP
jgi:hypothetical protein